MQLDVKQLQMDSSLTLEGIVACHHLAQEISQVQAVADAAVKAHATMESALIRLEANVRSNVTYVCSRCLEEFTDPLRTSLHETFSQQELEDKEVHRVSGRYITIDEYVEEAINLAIDPRPLCKSDCKGLCPDCGIDLNQSHCDCESKRVNPRFAALEGLLFDDDSE